MGLTTSLGALLNMTSIAIAIAGLLLLFSTLAYSEYPGSLASFSLFDLSFVAMLLLALPRPRSFVYFFFALMLFLGFWSKFMLHVTFGVPLLEPIGNFVGGPDAWDRVLDVASIAAIGISAARIIHIGCTRHSAVWKMNPQVGVPHWYPHWFKLIWVLSIFAMLLLNVFNFQFAFYQTGVNPRLVLPYHMNVLPGWLISIGFSLWFAVLLHWEFRRRPTSLRNSLMVPIAEGLVSSTFALSRSIYFLHSVPYFLAISSEWHKYRAGLSRRTVVVSVVSWALCFVLSLALVSFFRISIFQLAYVPSIVDVPGHIGHWGGTPPAVEASRGKVSPAKPPAGMAAANEVTFASMYGQMVHQVSALFLGRWIGLEGVMAVSAYPFLGINLVWEGFRSPRPGTTPIYQVMSSSPSEVSERFTFGSLPGIVGVLFYSGSLVMVVIGAMLVTLVMILTELAASRFTGNVLFSSVAAMGMAHVACQAQFPYLAGIFIAQLWVAIAFVWMLSAKVDDRGLATGRISMTESWNRTEVNR